MCDMQADHKRIDELWRILMYLFDIRFMDIDARIDFCYQDAAEF